MNEPVRVAIIGCGRMGRMHAERLAADGRGKAVALFDVDEAAAHSLRDALILDAAIYNQFAKLAAETRFDAAILCTPTQFHFTQAMALLERRIPVLCEKPLARTREEIVQLIAAARSTGTILAVAYQRRLLAIYQTMRRLVQSNKFGPIQAVASHNIENWRQTIGGTWRNDPQSNFGGFIGDAGSHKIDAAFFVSGLGPTEVFARTDHCGSRVEVTASVSALLTGNVPLTMDFIGHAQHFSEMLSIHCAEADLILRDGKLWRGGGGDGERVAITDADSNPVAAFLDLLQERTENFAPPECALPVYDFTQAIVESARLGRTVSCT
jgi:predicted dehydrogenase